MGQSRLKHTLLWVDERISKACEYLCIFLIVIMVVLVLLQVGTRYVLYAPLAWTEEAARYCVVWAGLLGTTLSFRHGYDVMLFQRPRMKKEIYNIFIRLVHLLSVVVFLAPVLWYAPGFIERQFIKTSEILEIPAGYITAVVPIFAFVILHHAVVAFFYFDHKEEAENLYAEI